MSAVVSIDQWLCDNNSVPNHPSTMQLIVYAAKPKGLVCACCCCTL